MSDIELVIKIPEDEYQNILRTGKASFCAVNAIEAGTPLPKGYGRLIDADATIVEIDKVYPNIDRQDIKQWFYNAPTIIEAYTESGQ